MSKFDDCPGRSFSVRLGFLAHRRHVIERPLEEQLPFEEQTHTSNPRGSAF